MNQIALTPTIELEPAKRPPLQLRVPPGHVMRTADTLRLLFEVAEAALQEAELAGGDGPRLARLHRLLRLLRKSL